MTGSRFNKWFIVRRRKSLAKALAGWMTLSLVFAFWPCCEILAQDQLPVTHVGTDAHGHGGAPSGTEDPCRTWLDSTDATLSTALGTPVSGFKLKAGHAISSGSRDFPAVPSPAHNRVAYHPPPPGSLPLYLRVRHLLI